MTDRYRGHLARSPLLLLAVAIAMFAPRVNARAYEDEPSPQTTAVAAYRGVNGTSLEMIPPPDFEPSAQFTGFSHMQSGSVIMVIEIPGPYEQASAAIPALLGQEGVTLISDEERNVADTPGRLVFLHQDTKGMEIAKWVWLFGDERRAGMIAATYHREYEETLGNAVRDAVLSVRWRDAPSDPFESIGF